MFRLAWSGLGLPVTKPRTYYSPLIQLSSTNMDHLRTVFYNKFLFSRIKKTEKKFDNQKIFLFSVFKIIKYYIFR